MGSGVLNRQEMPQRNPGIWDYRDRWKCFGGWGGGVGEFQMGRDPGIQEGGLGGVGRGLGRDVEMGGIGTEGKAGLGVPQASRTTEADGRRCGWSRAIKAGGRGFLAGAVGWDRSK